VKLVASKNVELHILGEKSNQNITSKLKRNKTHHFKKCEATTMLNYTFVCGEKSDLKITSKLNEANCFTSKMLGSNNFGLQTFMHGEKSNKNITSKLKGAIKTCDLKNVEQQ
jgi:hypothetical protein